MVAFSLIHIASGSRLANMDFLDDLTSSQPTPADGNRGPPMLDMLSDMLTLRDSTHSRSIVDPQHRGWMSVSSSAAVAAEAAQPSDKLRSLEASESRAAT